jgi:hypothetical protein
LKTLRVRRTGEDSYIIRVSSGPPGSMFKDEQVGLSLAKVVEKIRGLSQSDQLFFEERSRDRWVPSSAVQQQIEGRLPDRHFEVTKECSYCHGSRLLGSAPCPHCV